LNILDTTLLKYFEDKDPKPLEALIYSPSQIIESMVIPSNHVLLDEAILILDVLNSYNNGITGDDKEAELLDIPECSPLYSFRCGVLAIKEFYNNNQTLVTEYLNEVAESSPVKNLNKYLIKGRDTALFVQDKNLVTSVDALKEVIENSLIDMYPKTVKLLLDDIENVKEDELLNTILTIVEESVDNIPLEVIHKSIIPFIPISESTRLMALGTMYKFPVKSLGYLFSYANLAEFDDSDDENFKALLLIIKDIVKALIKEKYIFTNREEKRQFTKESNIFIHILRDFHTLEFKESSNPLTNLKRALDFKIVANNSNTNIDKIVQGELF